MRNGELIAGCLLVIAIGLVIAFLGFNPTNSYTATDDAIPSAAMLFGLFGIIIALAGCAGIYLSAKDTDKAEPSK